MPYKLDYTRRYLHYLPNGTSVPIHARDVLERAAQEDWGDERTAKALDDGGFLIPDDQPLAADRGEVHGAGDPEQLDTLGPVGKLGIGLREFGGSAAGALAQSLTKIGNTGAKIFGGEQHPIPAPPAWGNYTTGNPWIDQPAQIAGELVGGAPPYIAAGVALAPAAPLLGPAAPFAIGAGSFAGVTALEGGGPREVLTSGLLGATIPAVSHGISRLGARLAAPAVEQAGTNAERRAAFEVADRMFNKADLPVYEPQPIDALTRSQTAKAALGRAMQSRVGRAVGVGGVMTGANLLSGADLKDAFVQGGIMGLFDGVVGGRGRVARESQTPDAIATRVWSANRAFDQAVKDIDAAQKKADAKKISDADAAAAKQEATHVAATSLLDVMHQRDAIANKATTQAKVGLDTVGGSETAADTAKTAAPLDAAIATAAKKTPDIAAEAQRRYQQETQPFDSPEAAAAAIKERFDRAKRLQDRKAANAASRDTKRIQENPKLDAEIKVLLGGMKRIETGSDNGKQAAVQFASDQIARREQFHADIAAGQPSATKEQNKAGVFAVHPPGWTPPPAAPAPEPAGPPPLPDYSTLTTPKARGGYFRQWMDQADQEEFNTIAQKLDAAKALGASKGGISDKFHQQLMAEADKKYAERFPQAPEPAASATATWHGPLALDEVVSSITKGEKRQDPEFLQTQANNGPVIEEALKKVAPPPAAQAPPETAAAQAPPVEPVVLSDAAKKSPEPAMTDVADLGVRAGDLQFRTNVNERGVNPKRQIKGPWNATGVAPIIAWEDAQGKKWVVNGHHRYDLAAREGVKKILTQTLKESDGVTLEEAKIIGVESNIRDGTADVSDIARFVRGLGLTEAEAKTRGILDYRAGKQGFDLGTRASDDLLAAVENETLTADKAAAIANGAPSDKGLQLAGMKYAESNPRAKPELLEGYVKAVSRIAQEQGGVAAGGQEDMFSGTDWSKEADQIAKTAQAKIDALREDILSVRGTVQNAGRVESAKKLGLEAKNVKKTKKSLEELKKELARAERWHTDTEVFNELKAEIEKSSEKKPLQPKAEPPKPAQAPPEPIRPVQPPTTRETPPKRGGKTKAETDQQRYDRVRATPALQRTDADISFANTFSANKNRPIQEAEAKAKEDKATETRNTDGFAETKHPNSPMLQQRVRNALNQEIKFNGKLMSRKSAVRERVVNGATVGEKEGQRALINPSGSYLLEKQISSTAMDYAQHLAETINKDLPPVRESKPVEPPRAATPAAGGEALPANPESVNRTQAQKQPDGSYRLLWLGTRNEIFPGEKFKSPAEAKNYYKAQQAKQQGTAQPKFNLSERPVAARGLEQKAAFYSRLTRTVEQSPQGRGTGAQWKAIIKNSKLGTSPGEFDLVGVGDLEDGKVYTKQEVADYLRANEVQVKDVTLGGTSHEMSPDLSQYFEHVSQPTTPDGWTELSDSFTREAQRQQKVSPQKANRFFSMAEEATRMAEGLGLGRGLGGDQTKFSTYQLPGGKEGSYREVLLTVPWRPEHGTESLGKPGQYEIFYDGVFHGRVDNKEQAETSLRYFKENPANYGHIIEMRPTRQWTGLQKTAWLDGHSQYDDIPNPIVRLRYNERTTADGKRMLFLEEVQPPSKANQEKMPPLFVKNWREIGLKWALRKAAEDGYDSLGWTTGEQQAARYDLSKHLDGISITKNSAGEFAISGWKKGGENVIKKWDVPADEVEGYVGKELAAKALKQETNESVKYEGLDLKVGGEGLKKAYDSDFRNVVNGLAAVKKAGRKVGSAEIDSGRGAPEFQGDGSFRISKDPSLYRFKQEGSGWTIEEKAAEGEPWVPQGERKVFQSKTEALNWLNENTVSTIHSLDITPAIRESVMGGQPLFAVGEKGAGKPRAATLTRLAAQRVADQLLADRRIRSQRDINIHDVAEDGWPAEVQPFVDAKQVENPNALVKAVTLPNGTMHFDLGAHRNAADLRLSVAEEVSHKALGDVDAGLARSIWQDLSRNHGEALKAIHPDLAPDSMRRLYGNDEATLGGELVAKLALHGENPSWVQNTWAKIRDFFRKAFGVNWSIADVRAKFGRQVAERLNRVGDAAADLAAGPASRSEAKFRIVDLPPEAERRMEDESRNLTLAKGELPESLWERVSGGPGRGFGRPSMMLQKSPLGEAFVSFAAKLYRHIGNITGEARSIYEQDAARKRAPILDRNNSAKGLTNADVAWKDENFGRLFEDHAISRDGVVNEEAVRASGMPESFRPKIPQQIALYQKLTKTIGAEAEARKMDVMGQDGVVAHELKTNENFHHVPVTLTDEAARQWREQKGPIFRYLVDELNWKPEKPSIASASDIVHNDKRVMHIEAARTQKTPFEVWLRPDGSSIPVDSAGRPTEAGGRHFDLREKSIDKAFEPYLYEVPQRIGVVTGFGQRAYNEHELANGKLLPEVDKYFKWDAETEKAVPAEDPAASGLPGISTDGKGGTISPEDVMNRLYASFDSVPQREAAKNVWLDLNGRRSRGGIDAIDRWMPDWVKSIETLARTMMLAMSTPGQLTGIAPGAYMFGTRRMLTEVAKVAKHDILNMAGWLPKNAAEREVYQLLSKMSVISDNTLGHTTLTADMRGLAGQYSHRLLRMVGFEGINQELNASTGAAALGWLPAAIEVLKAPRDLKLQRDVNITPDHALSILKRNLMFSDADIARMKEGGVQYEDLSQAAQQAVAQANQFRETGLTMPGWLNGGFARRLFAFSGYARLQTQHLADVIREAKASPRSLAAWKPALAFIGVSGVTGIAAKAIHDYLLQKQDDDPSFLHKFLGGLQQAAPGGLWQMLGAKVYYNHTQGSPLIQIPQWEWISKNLNGIYTAGEQAYLSAKNHAPYDLKGWIQIVNANPLLKAIDAQNHGWAWQARKENRASATPQRGGLGLRPMRLANHL